MDELYKAVFHLDLNLEERLELTLANIQNLFKAIPPRQCDISVVANGNAVNLFRKDAEPSRLRSIHELNVRGVCFKLCANALASQQLKKEELLDDCQIVLAGIVEIINLQPQGFAYIRP